MSKKNRKLIVTDLDGTALMDEHTLHPHTKNVLKKAVEEGHIVCIATGRPKRSGIKFYKELGLDTIMANYNGSYVSNPKDPSYDGPMHTIKSDVIKEILTHPEVANTLIDAMCEFKDTIYAYEKTDDFTSWFHDEGAKKVVGQIEHIMAPHVNSCLIHIEDQDGIRVIEEIAAREGNIILRNWSVAVEGNPKILEVNPTGGNKGDALLAMAEHYGIDLEDTYCFGDMENDIEMLVVCPNSVAMANAKDEVKKHAKHVSDKANTEGAVGHWIEENILNKK